MSPETFMHTGYTGTCICIDPVNKLYSVVLTNRCVIFRLWCLFESP